MSLLSNVITLRLLSGLKPSTFILFLGYIYLGFLIFNSDITILQVLYVVLTVLLVVTAIIALKPVDKQALWDNDPDIKRRVAERMKRLEENQKKEESNPYE